MERPDGRQADELRPVRITRNYLKYPEGSCLIELGETKVICTATVSDGVPGWRRGSDMGWVTAEYAMLPRSTAERSPRESILGRLGGRTHEIQRLIGRVLRSVVDMENMGGETTVFIDCDVLQADGGTRTAAITGGMVALHDAFRYMIEVGRIAESPLTGFVAATSVGIVDGVPVLDLNYEEDSSAEVDMNVVMTADGRIVEIQGTAEREPFEEDMLDRLLALAKKGTQELVSVQRSAVEEKSE